FATQDPWLTAIPLATHRLRLQPPSPQDATFSHDSLQLLRDMAPTLPQLCPQHNASCSFNDTILDTSNTRQADKTTHDILQHLFKILSSPSTPAHWNDSQRQSLLNRIHRYTQHLEQCLDSSDTRSRTRWPRNLHLTIKKHFSCLHTFLQDNDYSACAWETRPPATRALSPKRTSHPLSYLSIYSTIYTNAYLFFYLFFYLFRQNKALLFNLA
uniref:Interferon alpha n=1 Tax=Gallus gallus TaxID=9031 RepID=A0A8V0Y5L9_CHICK